MSNNTRNFTHNSNYTFGTNMFGDAALYALQSVTLPGISFSHIDINKSAIKGLIQGDTATYNSLSLEFIVDEDLDVWKELATYAQELRNPNTSNGEKKNEYSWITIEDDQRNPVLKLTFYGTLLESFDDLQYSANIDDDIMTLTATLSYDYFIFE